MKAFADRVRAWAEARAAKAAKAEEPVSVVFAFGGWDAEADEAAEGGACVASRVTMAEAVRACAEACALAQREGWPAGRPVIVDLAGRRIAPGLS